MGFQDRRHSSICVISTSKLSLNGMGQELEFKTFYTSGQKSNSWTYNFVEVSGHNLESSQCLQCLHDKPVSNQFCSGGGGGGGKNPSAEGTVNNKEENSKTLSQLRPRIASDLVPNVYPPVFANITNYLWRIFAHWQRLNGLLLVSD